MSISIWNDEPCTSDLLGREAISRALAEVLETCDTPLVLGLYGSWGVGKTSLMRLVQSQLDSEASTVTVWFDAWQHQFDDNPAVALLHTMVKDLNLGEEGRRLLFTIAEAFGDSVLRKAAGISLNDIDAIQRKYDEERFAIRERQIALRSRFAKLIDTASEGGNLRIVFFIDDLDRCLPDNILSVLEALKLFLNLPGCVYVLGVDRTALERSIRRRYADVQEINEADYLDKIVQLPFTIPRVQMHSVSKYVHRLIPDELVPALSLLVEGLGQNPRQIKRFINSFVLNYTLAKNLEGTQDVSALAAILLLQLRNPDIYKELALDPTLLENPREEWMSDAVVSQALGHAKNGSPEQLRMYINLSEAAATRTITFDVVMHQVGERKIQVIKEVRVVRTLTLKETKDLVESPPPVVLATDLDRATAISFVQKLREAGAIADLQ